MSRFELDKFILYVDAQATRVEEFHSDPAGYVGRWRARAATFRLPVPNGGILDDDEAAALATRDYGRLYEMGVHPYLLLHFARALDVQIEGTPWPDFVERYRAAVSPFGFPDFAT